MGGVFDVTDFTGHPGGYGRLQMVAGQDLEPFWKIYTQHNREHIANHLDRYRIGQLSAADAEKQRLASVFPNPYLNDPEPSPDLLTNTRYRPPPLTTKTNLSIKRHAAQVLLLRARLPRMRVDVC